MLSARMGDTRRSSAGPGPDQERGCRHREYAAVLERRRGTRIDVQVPVNLMIDSDRHDSRAVARRIPSRHDFDAIVTGRSSLVRTHANSSKRKWGVSRKMRHVESAEPLTYHAWYCSEPIMLAPVSVRRRGRSSMRRTGSRVPRRVASLVGLWSMSCVGRMGASLATSVNAPICLWIRSRVHGSSPEPGTRRRALREGQSMFHVKHFCVCFT